MSIRRIILVAIASLLAIASCTAGAAPTPIPPLSVSDAWVRAAPMVNEVTAAYLLITSHGSAADTLVSASSPAATAVEIHETTTGMDDMTGMGEAGPLPVPAGGTLALKPGAFHLMFSGLKASLTAGGTVELDLHFEHAGTIVVQAVIRTD